MSVCFFLKCCFIKTVLCHEVNSTVKAIDTHEMCKVLPRSTTPKRKTSSAATWENYTEYEQREQKLKKSFFKDVMPILFGIIIRLY